MNFTIRTRLLAGFTLLVALLIGTAFFMSGKISESNQRLTNIADQSAKKIILSDEIMIALLDAGRHEKNIILEKDPSQKEYYRMRIYAALAEIDKKMNELEDLVDAGGGKILKEFKETWYGYKDDLKEIISLAVKSEDDKAFKISVDRGLKVRDMAIAQLQRLIDKNTKAMLNDKEENSRAYNNALVLVVILIVVGAIIAVLISYWIIKSVVKRIAGISAEAQKIASRSHGFETLQNDISDELKPIVDSLARINDSFREVTQNANQVAQGNYSTDFSPLSDKDILGQALKKMTFSLRETTAANEKHNWLTTGQNQLNEKLRGDQTIQELAGNTIEFLCSYLNAGIGAVYLVDDKSALLTLEGQYAFQGVDKAKKEFSLNEGLVGQAARKQNQLVINDVKEEELRIVSGVLNAKPRQLLVKPFLFEGKTLGVIEIGSLNEFSETELEFLDNCMESIAISINSAIARKRIQQLLEETQVQSEELQSQQEELRQVNEELEEQAQSLKQQQEELQITNEELEEQTQALEMKNKEIEDAKYDIEQKTKQLEISSKYKSEFLANMSHELRTPLNSLLILSKDLSENKKKNLDNEQVESAEIIYKSGTDLLTLINEVLDLSKIEAGKMSLNIENVAVSNLMNELVRYFKHHAEQKGIELKLMLDHGIPETIKTDAQRLNQVLKNLVSNAIKFTDRGSVTIQARLYTHNALIISVADTGIGIPEEKRQVIFEAFQQADGGTSRKYGGTGLGLSISRELAKLLSAEIKLESQVNKGSVFSVILPFNTTFSGGFEKEPVQKLMGDNYNQPKTSKYLEYPALEDDRMRISDKDTVLLIIEDDLKFAAILAKQAGKKGFKFLSAATGEDGLKLAARYKPNAIILDLDLPGIHGQQVLNELKANPQTRHIPVHIISVNERSLEPIKNGAIEYLMKPVNKKDLEDAFNRIENFVSRKMKNLLIVEDDENSRKATRKLIGNGDVKCLEAATASEALDLYKQNHIDCIVLDIGLPDMTGFELIYKLEAFKEKSIPPIIIYTGKDLTREENDELQKYAETIIIKGVKSEDRLLDETALFLHRTITNLPPSKQAIINSLYDKEAVFQDRKILVVDDDMRNVFALSKILRERHMHVIKADNGKNAIDMLEMHKDIDMVLMDIMMPEMDGYEAMKRIRMREEFKKLPIIALTAKAMKEDRQKCIDAGANDYISKPVDVERLLSLMRIWLSK